MPVKPPGFHTADLYTEALPKLKAGVTQRPVWREAKVGVVIPAFNEQRLIETTMRQIPEYVDRIFCVDDASTDRTWRVLRGLRKPSLQRRLVRVQHRDNCGVGAAIVTGYYRAISEDMSLIAVMAGDNQMAASDLGMLLDAALGGIDYVKGNRLDHALWGHMPRLRRWGSRALSWLTRHCTGLQVDDCQCGYTVIRADAAADIPLGCVWPRYGYPNDLLALLAAAGKSVGEVPVAPVYGPERSGLHAGHLLSIAARILRRRALQGTPRSL